LEVAPPVLTAMYLDLLLRLAHHGGASAKQEASATFTYRFYQRIRQFARQLKVLLFACPPPRKPQNIFVVGYCV
jgi:hypothetical protein